MGMKNLGKNKKKQWRHCYSGLEDKLEAVKRRELIQQEGFVLGRIKKPKQAFLKGNKDAAKPFPDIPSAPDGRTRFKRYTSKYRPTVPCDLWPIEDQQNVPNQPQLKQPKPNLSLPAAGQSYNPSVDDHYTLLSILGTEEVRKNERQRKTERFLRGFTENSGDCPDPLEEARSFFHTLSDNAACKSDQLLSAPVESSEEDETVIGRKKKKPKKVNMAVELENIPKLLKEIRREDQARCVRRSRLAFRKADRKRKQLIDWTIPFQMPNELVSCLRKVVPEGDLMSEVEKRKNKCPRARRTLGLTKNTKAYERRRVVT